EGFTDVFSAKYSEKGELIGAFTFGGPKSDFAQLAAYDKTLVLVTKFYGPFNLQGSKIDSTGMVNYLVGWFDDKGTLLHSLTLGSPADLEVSSIETDQKGTVYLTGWFTQNLKIGNKQIEALEGETAFMASIKNDGNEISVKRLLKPVKCRYYSSTIGKDSLIYVVGITSDAGDSLDDSASETYNNLFVSTFEKGEMKDTCKVLLKGIDLVPVSVKATGDTLWIASRFKYNCLNGQDTISAKGQHDVLMHTWCPTTNRDTTWTIGGYADDLPLNLTVSGRQVMLSGTYSDKLMAGNEELQANELGSDLFLVSYDAKTLKQFDAFSIGGTNNDFPCAATTSKAGVYLLGQFKEMMEVGLNKIQTNGSYDVFVARYENCDAKNAISIAARAKSTTNGQTTYELKAEDGYKTYKWNNPLGYGQSVEAKEAGSYIVEALDSYGCPCHGEISLSKNKNAVIPDPNDVQEQTAEFKLYPTITEGMVYWQAGEKFPEEGATLRVYNATGKVIVEEIYPGNTGSTTVHAFNLNQQSPGVYLVEVSGKGYSKIEKVILK
ncbi:MAG: T9SS type A sorting domain-containing protein, partial [Methylococcaceae bacterium]